MIRSIKWWLRDLDAVPAWAAVAALVAASTFFRAWGSTRISTPWINADEFIYAELGRSLYETGHLELLGHPTHFYSVVYPALIGLPLALFDVGTGYAIAKTLQALVMSLTAVPVYLWARSLSARGWALAAAALTLSIPGLAYSGLLMSEVAFYPATALAAWAMAAALAKPRPRTQALALAAIVLAVLTRLQALVLAPVFVTAIVLDALLAQRSARRLRAHVPALAGLALLAVGWSAGQLVGGGPVGQVLGAYQAAAEVSYSASAAARFVAWHLADVAIVTAVAPVCAVALLVVEAIRREVSPRLRAYLAVTVALVGWTVVEVGVFASRHVGWLAERDLLGLAPVLFVGLAAWASQGAPRPPKDLIPVAVVIGILMLALPMGRLATDLAPPDAFMMIPLLDLRDAFPSVDLDLIILQAAAIPLFAFAFLPQRMLWLLPAGTIALFVILSLEVSGTIAREAHRIQGDILGQEPRWVDMAADGDVTFLYVGDQFWTAAYEHLFWNRRIRRVIDLPGPQVPGPMPQTVVDIGADGSALDHGRPVASKFVVTRSPVSIDGFPVAHTRQPEFVLWRARRPLRVSAWLVGMRVDRYVPRPNELALAGSIGSAARLAIYGCGRGRVVLTLVAPQPAAITLERDGEVVRRITLAADGSWSGSVPLVRKLRGRGQCEFTLDTTSLVNAIRFELIRG